MPTVPYSPVPDVAPTQAGTPRIGIATPVEAFGGGVAQALEGFGQTLERSGDELFNRAIALQQLRNETEAKEADAQYMIKAGEIHANFSALRGKAAVDAYPGYVQNLQDLRTSLRDGLSNDMARRMYDSSSLSTMGRTIFNGAGHAATENKMWAAGASKARVDSMKDAALASPNDDVGFQRSMRAIDAEVASQGDIGGWSSDQIANQAFKDKSEMWARRIEGLSRTNPYAAKAMLEEHRKDLHFNDEDRADKVVASQLHLTGSRNISDAVNAGWAAYMRPNEIDRAAGVQEPLTRIVREAQRAHPELQFTIGDHGGTRTPEEQAALVAKGVSQTMHSDHLTGRAIDLVPETNGKPNYDDRDAYAKIDAAMQEAAQKLGIPLKPKSAKFQAWDPGHYALPDDYDVRLAGKPVEEPLQSRVNRAVDYAKQFAPDDTAFHDAVRDRTISDFNRAKAIQRDADFTNMNTISGALVGNYGGKIPTTREELLALDPRVAASWNQLDETKQRTVLRALAQNAKGDIPETPETLKRYQQLKGMAFDDPEEFLGVDMTNVQLPLRDRRELINLQLQKKAKAGADPRVLHAMQVLAPDLGAAGITKQQDPDGYRQFVGALQDQLEDFQSAHKRPPLAKEIREIGAQLVQQQSAPAWYWPWGKEQTFRMSVPDEEAAKIRADPAWARLGIEPTDDQIQRVYVRAKFRELYGGRLAKPAEAKPTVPMSQ